MSLSHEQVAPLAADPRFRRYEGVGGLTYLGFNFQHARWQNLRVRQAVAAVIDKQSLAALGPFSVANTPLTPNAIGYASELAGFGYAYAPARSRSLLDVAQFDGGVEVVMLVPEGTTYHEIATVVRRQLADAGIRSVHIRALPRAAILNQRQDFDLLLFDYAWSHYQALAVLLGPGPRNLLNYPNDDIAALVTRARATGDPAERQRLINDAQRIVLEQAIWQPLLVRRITVAVDGACVTGERLSPVGELVFHDARTAPLPR
jgi:peptide/nickel transport system substrate-binding protein